MFPLGLNQFVTLLNRLENRALEVHPHQCSRVRHRLSRCTRCADACPTQAIVFTDSMQVESSRCIDCGVCATVCPTGALESKSPTNAELLDKIRQRIETNPSIVFACSKYSESTHIPSTAIIQVKCLGRLDESILFGAIALGAQSVSLLDGVCADCPQIVGRKIVGETTQKANALLAAFGVSQQIIFYERRFSQAEMLASSSEVVSRRGFFDYMLRETIKAGTITASAVLTKDDPTSTNVPLPKGQLPQRVPAKTDLILTAMRKIGKPVTNQWSKGIWAQFGFTDKCNGCQICAFFCPTGALAKIEQAGKTGVTFKISTCTDCKLCQQICYQSGVTLAAITDLNKVVADTVDTFLMADKTTAPWNVAAEDRVKIMLKTTLGIE